MSAQKKRQDADLLADEAFGRALASLVRQRDGDAEACLADGEELDGEAAPALGPQREQATAGRPRSTRPHPS